MLLETLKGEQEKQSFANLAYRVARADGSISLADITMFDMFDKEMELPKRMGAVNESIPELCSKFTDHFTKEIIFTNLLSFAYTEKFTNFEQKQTLDQIREALDISLEEETRQRNWMKMIKGSFFPECYFD